MRVIWDLPARPVRRPLSLAIGVFDGVHLGHRAIIEAARRFSAPHALEPSVLTFDPHPDSVIRPGQGPPLLTTPRERLSLLQDLGVRTAIVARFDRALAATPAEAFARDILIGRLRARCITIGLDWRFGAKGAGDARLLARLAPWYGFHFYSSPSVLVEGTLVSSTLIRSLLVEGRVEEAARLLGRPYQLSSIVEPGDQRGRQLGFPTANLSLPPTKAVPADGVYACWAGARRFHPAVVSLGTRPTFEAAGQRRLEVHLLDQARKPRLLGRRLHVAFAAFLRGDQRFQSAEVLVAQIEADCEEARAVLSALQPPARVL